MLLLYYMILLWPLGMTALLIWCGARLYRTSLRLHAERVVAWFGLSALPLCLIAALCSAALVDAYPHELWSNATCASVVVLGCLALGVVLRRFLWGSLPRRALAVAIALIAAGLAGLVLLAQWLVWGWNH